ncbi:hypothetical protein DL93DRAFT_2082984 [Clavulina sp. PMI_390]|nr:hypothetical protein DL93DRAFT_2082984 [Clavulina sp. PMI_390]
MGWSRKAQFSHAHSDDHTGNFWRCSICLDHQRGYDIGKEMETQGRFWQRYELEQHILHQHPHLASFKDKFVIAPAEPLSPTSEPGSSSLNTFPPTPGFTPTSTIASGSGTSYTFVSTLPSPAPTPPHRAQLQRGMNRANPIDLTTISFPPYREHYTAPANPSRPSYEQSIPNRHQFEDPFHSAEPLASHIPSPTSLPPEMLDDSGLESHQQFNPFPSDSGSASRTIVRSSPLHPSGRDTASSSESILAHPTWQVHEPIRPTHPIDLDYDDQQVPGTHVGLQQHNHNQLEPCDYLPLQSNEASGSRNWEAPLRRAEREQHWDRTRARASPTHLASPPDSLASHLDAPPWNSPESQAQLPNMTRDLSKFRLEGMPLPRLSSASGASDQMLPEDRGKVVWRLPDVLLPEDGYGDHQVEEWRLRHREGLHTQHVPPLNLLVWPTSLEEAWPNQTGARDVGGFDPRTTIPHHSQGFHRYRF